MNTFSAKEQTQYGTAIFTLLSGIVLCFLSFFLNEYQIHDSVLFYFGQSMIFCGGVFGINIYVKSKLNETETKLNEKIRQIKEEK